MNWTNYFMGFAQHAAQKSKDPSTQVGCVLVGPDDEIRSTGFNGIPRGVRDNSGCDDPYEDDLSRMQRPQKYLWMGHAEENAVAHAARVGVSLKGCAAYVTHHPCARCARLLIQSGVTRVIVAENGITNMQKANEEEFRIARVMFSEAAVEMYTARVMDSDGGLSLRVGFPTGGLYDSECEEGSGDDPEVDTTEG